MVDQYPTRGTEESIFDRLDPVVRGKEEGEFSLSNEEAKFFEKNGFVIFPEFFSQKEVESYIMPPYTMTKTQIFDILSVAKAAIEQL